MQATDPSNSRNSAQLTAAQQANRDIYQMPPNGYMPNGFYDPSAYQSQQHAYMSNYHRYDMSQMHNAAASGQSINSAYMNAASGYGMYSQVSGGQTSPYGSLQQPGSPYNVQQQQPGSPYGLNQGGGSQISCQSHSPSDSSVKSEPVSPGPVITNNNHMKREYGQPIVGGNGGDISHLINMYHVPDSLQTTEHQRTLMQHYQSASPDQQTLRMAPLTHM